MKTLRNAYPHSATLQDAPAILALFGLWTWRTTPKRASGRNALWHRIAKAPHRSLQSQLEKQHELLGRALVK